MNEGHLPENLSQRERFSGVVWLDKVCTECCEYSRALEVYDLICERLVTWFCGAPTP